ncbi:conserved hypothetical protein [Lodderomyces elongisporus NRRL YB-4239]|uniref:C2H2-type domain-containing protein n=1 Tax=Lodderomyces elongisporus (strain ATCC 11503 / CBS 2605 / JCM 1781 / NBRC 1676 / NRRL YB-4239) TaxID=379508 RepID=A5E0T3_LODEL|nr:conserved hypothetical protein [Lodderomyces elongisporus NRRL YB-4239]
MSQITGKVYECLTCSEKFENSAEAQKHFSLSRHKSVKLIKLDEVLACEECLDSNIHQVSIVRYGLNDMALLCAQCLQKSNIENETEPSANYTLSNGAIFTKLDQYLKFRDIECILCGETENTLYVGNTAKGQVIACKNCLPQYESQKISFVSEDDDKFLSELLGIKDFVAKPLSRGRGKGKRGGKAGRGGKSGTRPPRKPRKDDPEAEARRIHYEETKKAASNVKAGSTVKAIGSVTVGRNQKKEMSTNTTPSKKFMANGSKSNTPRGTPKDTPRGTPKDTPRGTPKDTPRGTPKDTPRGTPSPRSQSPSGKSLKKPSPVFLEKDSLKKTSVANNKKTSKKETSQSTVLPNGQANSVINTNSQSKTKSNSKSNSKSNLKLISDLESNGKNIEANSKANSRVKSGKKSGNLVPLENTESRNGTDQLILQGGKGKQNKGATSQKKNVSAVSNSKTLLLLLRTSKDRNAISKSDLDADSVTQESELVLPPYITKYHPSTTLKLSYDTLDEYFREMSFNVFLEDQFTNELNIIEPEDLMIEWYQDQDKKNNQFKVSIPMTPEVIDRFISDRFKKLKRDPFQKDQAMFLILNDEIPWYGKVATVDAIKTGQGRGKGKGRGRGRGNARGKSDRAASNSSADYVSLIITLYRWNNQPLPKTVHAQHLKLLPASVPVSRILNAMDNLVNPSFAKMLLGKEPIKQIYFNNRVNFSTNLNDSQRAAIQSVLNNKISVVRGPPGTGKTSAIYETIIQLLESLNTYPILVVAASNIAIDNIAEKLLPKHGKLILRITASEKEKEYNKSHPLSSICLHHKIYNALPLKFQQVQDDLRRGTGVVSANAYKNFMQEKFQITKQQVAQAKVILTTTVVAGGPQMKSVAKCPVVIMDEATQSSEPSTLIPLAVPGADKFVFVGDQKQLSCFSLIPSLSTSLFERVLLNGTYKAPHMLDTQYRMHPAISEFPRNRFYGGELKDGIDASARAREGIPLNPVYFWDTRGKAREQSVLNYLREDRGYTYSNRDEISYIQQILRVLILEKGIKREDIGVITPYSGQRDLISSTLVKDEVINPQREELKIEIDVDDIRNDSKPVNIHIVSGVMIASIDAFQGREKDFMVMSCVRSNTQGVIGFLRDERRLNVALTRARYGMIMVGDVKTLKLGDKLWKEYMEYLEERKLIHGGDKFDYL